ncbi:hypothetical protein CDL15_Pgr000223 [Punica granatum]|uniref:Uncharacterized protein n=1 Tax=Punica granatum TaxID=22663 RepID=A0A218Y368_PUNGR|nr:hypothetical protein CDL15_Pgr000223 [Punica granatum]
MGVSGATGASNLAEFFHVVGFAVSVGKMWTQDEAIPITMIHQYHETQEIHLLPWKLRNLPRGIVQAASDLELRPLWSHSNSKSKVGASSAKIEYPTGHYLLAMPVGIKQKHNVDAVVQKFLPENFTVILFHYDGKVNEWNDLEWSGQALHIVAQNQTKCYLKIVKSAGLEISQPALDPNSTDIHHRITIRSRTKKFHRRVWDARGSVKCTNTSWGPPCTGFVEGMAPVFSRAAWFCTWHLLQNDLVHGWGMDMKLGYCAQGDRTKKVGVVDSEYIVHQGIQTLGGGGHPGKKASYSEEQSKRHSSSVDVRAEIRRQSTRELDVFKKRWNKAVEEDKDWSDPFTKDSVVPGDEYMRRRKAKRRRKHRA